MVGGFQENKSRQGVELCMQDIKAAQRRLIVRKRFGGPQTPCRKACLIGGKRFGLLGAGKGIEKTEAMPIQQPPDMLVYRMSERYGGLNGRQRLLR